MTARPPFEPEPLLTPGEAATALHVSPKTLVRWTKQEKLPVIRTLGRHRRYRQADIEAILRGEKP